MSVETINKLVQKYFDGDTSLEEEQALKAYFSGDKIDEKLVKYAPIFHFLKVEKTVKISDELAAKIESISVEKQPKMTVVKTDFYWLKLAASLTLLLIGTWSIAKQFRMNNNTQYVNNQPINPVKRKARVIILDETTDPKLAFAEVEKALLLVSKNMKKGTDETTESLQKFKSATKVISQ
jgi:hypothetical protein